MAPQKVEMPGELLPNYYSDPIFEPSAYQIKNEKNNLQTIVSKLQIYF